MTRPLPLTGPDPVVFGHQPRFSNPDHCWYCGDCCIIPTSQGATCEACRTPQDGFDPREGLHDLCGEG